MYLKCDLHNYDLKNLKSKFDVILVEPPLEEYQRTMGVTNMEFWGWEQVCLTDFSQVAGTSHFANFRLWN